MRNRPWTKSFDSNPLVPWIKMHMDEVFHWKSIWNTFEFRLANLGKRKLCELNKVRKLRIAILRTFSYEKFSLKTIKKFKPPKIFAPIANRKMARGRFRFVFLLLDSVLKIFSRFYLIAIKLIGRCSWPDSRLERSKTWQRGVCK